MIFSNLAALQVVVPLIGAPLCTLFGRGILAWALSTAITWFAFAVSISSRFIGTKDNGKRPKAKEQSDWRSTGDRDRKVVPNLFPLYTTGVIR